MSSYEEKIMKILKSGKIRFRREVSFSDLKKGLYRFDFEVYLPSGRVLLECNGEQHYEYVSRFFKSRRQFEAAKERDRRKISYCLAHDIPLYIVPYWEIQDLNSVEDLFQSKFLAHSRWKNDQDKSKFDKYAKIRYNKRVNEKQNF